LSRRQDPFADGTVAEGGKKREQYVHKLLQQERRKRVKLARLRSRGEDDVAQVSSGDGSHGREVAGRRREDWKRKTSRVLPDVQDLG